MVFTVELKGDPKKDAEVEIFVDEDSLDLLIARLGLLKKNKDHEHFMTPSWAGNELTEEKVSSGELLNCLKIIYVPQ